MNMMPSNPMIPASPKRLDDLGLPKVMMMDLLLKTMFRKSLDRLTDIAKTLCLSQSRRRN